MRLSGLAVFPAVLLLVSSVATPVLAQDYPEDAERLCTGDAFRLCSSEMPFVERITACMIRRQTELSPGCRAVVAAQAPSAVARGPAPRNKPRRPAPIFQDDD